MLATIFHRYESKSAIDKSINTSKVKLLNFATTHNFLLFVSTMIFPKFTGMTVLVAVKIMRTCCFLLLTQLLINMPWITTGLKVSTRKKNKLYASGDEVRYITITEIKFQV